MDTLAARHPVGLYEKALPSTWSWDRRLAASADAGYDFAEISIDESDERLARLEWPAAVRADVRRAIAASGVPIMTMCLSGHRRFPLGSKSPPVRERSEEILRRAIELSVDLGIRIVQVPGYDVYFEESDDGTVERFLEGVQQGAEWAGQAGVMLALENVDVPLSESLGRCMEIVRRVASPWLQIYPDMANVAAAGYDPVPEIALCSGHMVAVHVKDSLPRTIRRVPFGAGIVHFEPVFRTLARLGYRGPMVVEMWADADPAGDPQEKIEAARRFVGALIDKTYN